MTRFLRRPRYFSSSITVIAGVLAFLSEPAVANADEKKEPDAQQVKIDDLTLSIPAAWKQERPSNRLRTAQFQIPPATDDDEPVELAVYHFAGGGGGVAANIKRWIGQFQQKGRKAKVTKGASSQGPYVFVDISGTWNQPVGPPVLGKTKPLPDARLLAVILQVKKVGKIYYLRVAGPEKTVTAAADDVRGAIGADASQEKELKLGEESP